ncbi:hypothetical protein GUJ93_ZPchr0007g4290 [Zizania palustris]|uniref:Uncharacterized protein n=1 Tax=Zizania palustris TaxID=103762 RepID=A0A8J5VRC7_ZIZPA|nr:hypothetical protein GUJ93_ZPchr0007g4290 [Zizania palustris]
MQTSPSSALCSIAQRNHQWSQAHSSADANTHTTNPAVLSLTITCHLFMPTTGRSGGRAIEEELWAGGEGGGGAVARLKAPGMAGEGRGGRRVGSRGVSVSGQWRRRRMCGAGGGAAWKLRVRVRVSAAGRDFKRLRLALGR